MTEILITGGAGMIGRKLADRLAADGSVAGEKIDRLVLQDIVQPATLAAPFEVGTVAGDFAQPGQADALVASRPDVVFHLAAIPSGGAEADFDKGYRINLDGTRLLLDAIRQVGGGYRPRLVFTSSIAVF
ncbi:MAG: putative UDP-glucose 4-epimerase, partial [Rhodospirillales bacterium]|nr:putative UDP-glucose 4-epimerase [Rhodospirillales bacterium]